MSFLILYVVFLRVGVSIYIYIYTCEPIDVENIVVYVGRELSIRDGSLYLVDIFKNCKKGYMIQLWIARTIYLVHFWPTSSRIRFVWWARIDGMLENNEIIKNGSNKFQQAQVDVKYKVGDEMIWETLH